MNAMCNSSHSQTMSTELQGLESNMLQLLEDPSTTRPFMRQPSNAVLYLWSRAPDYSTIKIIIVSELNTAATSEETVLSLGSRLWNRYHLCVANKVYSTHLSILPSLRGESLLRSHKASTMIFQEMPKSQMVIGIFDYAGIQL